MRSRAKERLFCRKSILDLRSSLLDYYVCGFLWAKEGSFTDPQTCFMMAVLQLLVDNIRGEEEPEVLQVVSVH